MAEIKILKQLKEQLVLFFDELIDLLPQEADLVMIRIFIKDKFPIQDIMEYMTKKLLPLKDMIINKDEGFFLQNNILFEKFEKNKVNRFKTLWRSDILEEEDKETLWKWFKSFVYLVEKYQKTLQV